MKVDRLFEFVSRCRVDPKVYGFDASGCAVFELVAAVEAGKYNNGKKRFESAR